MNVGSTKDIERSMIMGKIGYRRRKNMPHNKKRRIEKLKKRKEKGK